MKHISELREEVKDSVYNMVSHDDDIELADEIIDNIMKSISRYDSRMEIKKLDKYTRSTLNGVLIKELECYEDGTIIIVSEDNSRLECEVDEDILEASGEYGDYIICDLQDKRGVEVNKP